MNAMNWKFIRNILIKALVLFVVFNLVVIAFSPFSGLGKLSLYNLVFPGRQRFPFGEVPQQTYSFTINDLDALFSSHVVSRSKPEEEYRVFILGDSSAWGTLLHPEETLAGRLNAMQLSSADGRQVVFYNLAYPTLSLWKDVLILDYAMQYQPDLILWPMTLESFPGINKEESPLLTDNRNRLNNIFARYELPTTSLETGGILTNNFLTQRRSLADWYRLQLYGVLWAATGIDQDYSQTWNPARRDFEESDTLAQLNNIAETDLTGLLDFTPIETGIRIASDTPVIFINEPIMVSTGLNHEIRYNDYYPVWAYDQYRTLLTNQCAVQGWTCLDAWDLVPEDQFTNSAIHMTPAGERLFAQFVADYLTTAGLVTK